MEEIGKIVGIDGERARVEIEPKGGCSHCSARMICNPSGNKMYTEAINEKGAKVGNIVKLEMDPGSTILAAVCSLFFQ
jgi:positive regulator of sigma E activity